MKRMDQKTRVDGLLCISLEGPPVKAASLEKEGSQLLGVVVESKNRDINCDIKLQYTQDNWTAI